MLFTLHCLLNNWLPMFDSLKAENNLSETEFVCNSHCFVEKKYPCATDRLHLSVLILVQSESNSEMPSPVSSESSSSESPRSESAGDSIVPDNVRSCSIIKTKPPDSVNYILRIDSKTAYQSGLDSEIILSVLQGGKFECYYHQSCHTLWLSINTVLLFILFALFSFHMNS